MARLDTLFTKSYRVERETEVSILIDASASMGLPVKDDKFGLARVLGAALAYVALGENDPVRLISFGGPRGQLAYRTTEFYRRRESYASFRPMLTEIKCAGSTEMADAVEHFLNQRRPPGVAIVLSDFLVSVLALQGGILPPAGRALRDQGDPGVGQPRGRRESWSRRLPPARL